jgi:hypothetical protein
VHFKMDDNANQQEQRRRRQVVDVKRNVRRKPKLTNSPSLQSNAHCCLCMYYNDTMYSTKSYCCCQLHAIRRKPKLPTMYQYAIVSYLYLPINCVFVLSPVQSVCISYIICFVMPLLLYHALGLYVLLE